MIQPLVSFTGCKKSNNNNVFVVILLEFAWCNTVSKDWIIGSWVVEIYSLNLSRFNLACLENQIFHRFVFFLLIISSICFSVFLIKFNLHVIVGLTARKLLPKISYTVYIYSGYLKLYHYVHVNVKMLHIPTLKYPAYMLTMIIYVSNFEQILYLFKMTK